MIIKVCGLTRNDISQKIYHLNGITMVGYNFYPQSARYIDYKVVQIPENDKMATVGVFVGESIDKVKVIVEALSLKYVQLHSLEDQNYINECLKICKVIKAVGIENENDIKKAEEFEGISYLLFDKKSKEYGGTGIKFDWGLLDSYKGKTPFLLAGGIGPEDVKAIREINHPMFAGIDINSKFEDSPGIKNVKLISEFLENLEK